MEQNNFKVVYRIKNIICLSGMLLVLEGIVLMCALCMWEQMRPSGKIFTFIFYPGIMLYFMITRFLSYVKVEGRLIKVRTKFGRKYQFSCREIDKVACFSDYQAKGGPAHDLRMEVSLNGKRVDTYVFSSMKGFSTMAGYLIEMHERGEIKEEAISKSCKKMLTRYKNLEEKK